MKQKSFELICCPECYSALELENSQDGFHAGERLYCEGCDEYYPIISGIPDFLKARHMVGSAHKRVYEKTGTLFSALDARLYEYNAKYLVGWTFGGGLSFNYVKDVVWPTAKALRVQEGDVALDLACGTGILARIVAPQANERGFVVGLDISLDRLKCARAHARREGLRNIDLMKGDAESLPYKTGFFDKVAVCGAFSGFPNPGKSLNEIHRILREGGILSLAVRCNYQNFHVKMLKRIADKVDKRYKELNWYERDELIGLVENAGFKSIDCTHLGGAFSALSARK